MDAETARIILNEFNKELVRTKEEREMLLTLISGLEEWLRIDSIPKEDFQALLDKMCALGVPADD